MRKKEEYKVANNNISNQILGAIDISVDRALQQANFNKTVEGEILYCLNQITGKYRVLIDGVETNAYSLNGTVYSINDRVYIQFQSGKDVTDKYIIGKKQNITAASGIQSLSFDKRYHIGGEFSFTQDPKDNNIYSIQLEKGETVSDYVLEVFQTISCGLQFNLTVKPDKYEDINEDDDNYTITLIDNNNAILTTITMDALEGNPYSMEKQSQVFIFENKDFLGLKSISINASGRFENKVSIESESIKFFVAQDLTDPTVENYLIRKEEYGQLSSDGSSWTAFKWLSISNKWQKYVKTDKTSDGAPDEWEWTDADVEKDEKPTHVRTWLELYDKGRRRADLQCHWFVANGAIDEKSNVYSSYMGAGWEKKKTTSAVTVDTNDLANSLIIPFTELPLKNTKYAYYTLLNHLEFAKAEFIITNPLQADGIYALTQQVTNTSGVDFINGFTIKAQLKLDNQEVSITEGDIVYDWEVKDVFRGTTLIKHEPGLGEYDYKVSGNTLVFKAGAILSILQIRVTVKAYWEKGSTQFFLADDTQEYKNSSEIKLYSLQLTNTDQVFYYNGGMREGAEPMPIEAQLVKLNTDTGEWSSVDNDQWKFKGEKPTLLAASLIKDINVNNSTKICGFTVQDIYNASATSNQIKFSATITSGKEDIEIATEYTNFAFIQSGDPGTNGTEYVAQVYDKQNDNKIVNFIFHPKPTVQIQETFAYTFVITDLIFDPNYDPYQNNPLILLGFKYAQRIAKKQNSTWTFLDYYPDDFKTISVNVYGNGYVTDNNIENLTGTFISSASIDYDQVLDDNIEARGEYRFESGFELTSGANLGLIVSFFSDDDEWNTTNEYKVIVLDKIMNEGGVGSGAEILSINSLDGNKLPDAINAIYTSNETITYQFNTSNYGLKLTNIRTGEEQYTPNPTVTLTTEHYNNEDEPRLLNLCAAYNDIDYYAYASVVMVNNQNDIPFDRQSGFNYILYGSNGKNARTLIKPFLNNSHQVVNCEIMQPETKGYLTYNEDTKLYELTQKPLSVEDKYVSIKVADCIVPILLLKNRYEYASINGWDGTKLQLDKNGQHILSPMGGFGQKETDNSFTGVVLGESCDTQKNQTSIGLMAYNKGERTVFIDARTGAAYFQGEIVAGSGNIAGFEIKSDKLWKKEGSKEVGLSTNDGKDWAFWAGNSDGYGEGAPFRVDHEGNFYASQGNLGGWLIKSNLIMQSAELTDAEKELDENQGYEYRGTGLQHPGSGICSFAAGFLLTTKNGSDSWSDTAPFYVTHKGELYANKGYIGGCTLTDGGISASQENSSNNLPSWELNSSGLCQVSNISLLNSILFKNDITQIDLRLAEETKTAINTTNYQYYIYAYIGKNKSGDCLNIRVDDPYGLAHTTYLNCTLYDGNYSYDYSLQIMSNQTYTISEQVMPFGHRQITAYKLGGNEIVGNLESWSNTSENENYRVLWTHNVSVNSSVKQPTLLFSGCIAPSADGYYSLGTVDKQWDNLRVSTVQEDSGTQTTSDINLKNSIMTLNDSVKYNVLFDNLSPVIYKYNKGTSDRKHIGFIAQEVKQAMDVAELSTQDFAGLTIENHDKPEEEQIWRLRYSEFIALNTDQIQKLKKRVAQLEAQLAEIKGETNDND